MTAENEKQYVEGRIQDFDAVSLYPSAMNVMDGVPKGIPKVIPSNITTEQLLKYDTFFVEINIKKLKCKSEHPYKFGLVFRKNDAGSKIFDNNPIDNFYIDKVGLLDLIEYYEIEFEVIRGYYFDEGFNKKINQFIEGLFNLCLKYKKEKNPLQSTIKLLLNSVYGKSILKAIKTETKTVPKDKLMKYIWRNYNFIKEMYSDGTILELNSDNSTITLNEAPILQVNGKQCDEQSFYVKIDKNISSKNMLYFMADININDNIILLIQ